MKSVKYDKPLLTTFKARKTDHGGAIKHPQKRARPLPTKNSIHLVLRSSKAHGKMSFYKHKKDIDRILKSFAQKYHVQIQSYANVGNHLHLHLKLFSRQTYVKFIRAITAAITMKVTGFCRDRPKPLDFKFWDQRPFTRWIQSYKAFQNIVDYIQINTLEAMGYTRLEARAEVRRCRFEFKNQTE